MRSIYIERNVSDPNMITQLDARLGSSRWPFFRLEYDHIF
jgi:hypothetical protein